jgi:hypothetical protein
MSAILALDPGLTKPGVALYHHDELLSAERLVVPKELSKLGILDRSCRVAELAYEWFCGYNYPLTGFLGLTLIVEWPQWYGSNEKGIDPNDLAGLCAINGALLGRLRAGWREIKVLSPKPREVWGSLPKTTRGDPWISPRGQRLASRLNFDERRRVGNYHDALDAAGLVLFAAGRWTARRVYPGAVA